jgi:hypothetical protein
MAIIICPKSEKKLPVSTTIKPVTQTALVDVNIASISEIFPVEAFGSIKIKEPAVIIVKKLITNN